MLFLRAIAAQIDKAPREYYNALHGKALKRRIARESFPHTEGNYQRHETGSIAPFGAIQKAIRRGRGGAQPVSFHVNTDSSTLIGTDTFTGGEVRLRRGPVALAAQYGGFCILDEINMAKNDAVAVLHSALDYRRLIDVPGYECIPIHPAARFIATMNYGYAGTRELNEALVSRFTVIRMPTLEEPQLCELLRANVSEASDENIKRCTGLFLDLNAKAVNGEISTNSVDMRGMIAALHLMTDGMAPKDAIAVSITNKCFDEYEYELVRDVALTRFA